MTCIYSFTSFSSIADCFKHHIWRFHNFFYRFYALSFIIVLVWGHWRQYFVFMDSNLPLVIKYIILTIYCMGSVFLPSTLVYLAFSDPGYAPMAVDGDTYCIYCLRVKEHNGKRNHHCATCSNCVEDFDHHCPALGNCVAKNTVVLFYFFISSIPFFLLPTPLYVYYLGWFSFNDILELEPTCISILDCIISVSIIGSLLCCRLKNPFNRNINTIYYDV